jgi:hypothetical protein
LPTWGLWPATAVALAGEAGAARIGLLGIDLGTVRQPDPAFMPLALLLGLLARVVDADTLDCGAVGALKDGWTVECLDAMAADGSLDRLQIRRTPAPSIDERICVMREMLGHALPVVERARDMLALGLRARAGETVAGLETAASEMLSWSAHIEVRISLQEALGLSFLPRLWRTGIDLSLGRSLWRPVVLAAHELVGQAQRLDALTKRAAA